MGSDRAQRKSSLDLLRFVAATAVMLYHFIYRSAEGGGNSRSLIQAVTRHAYLGVDVFFIISGFVVLWSARGRSASRFLRARILRLYPEFWIAVLVSALVFTLVPGGFGASLDARTIALNLTMIPQYLGAPYVDRVYWTLGVEIKFYILLWALIVLRQIRRIEAWLYGWLALLGAASIADVGPILRWVSIFPYGSLFASGGLFFLAFDSGWTRARAAGIGAGFALSAYHAVGGMTGFVDAGDITRTAQAVTVGIVLLAFLAFTPIVRRPGKRASTRMAAVGVTAGALTYPLYLLHNTGREIFLNTRGWGPRWLAVSLAILFSLAISWGVMLVGNALVKPTLRRILDGALNTSSFE
jgi:peptidoglycan/LPS O-acetylase OafA/YrhL